MNKPLAPTLSEVIRREAIEALCVHFVQHIGFHIEDNVETALVLEAHLAASVNAMLLACRECKPGEVPGIHAAFHELLTGYAEFFAPRTVH